jgi:hypothetical protein
LSKISYPKENYRNKQGKQVKGYSVNITETCSNDNLQSPHDPESFYSGDYLIKSKNQILTGVGLQISSVVFVLVMSDSFNNRISDSRDQEEINQLTSNRKRCYIGASVVSVIGFGFELAGINNIGEAGLSLNENGVGVKVKF